MQALTHIAVIASAALLPAAAIAQTPTAFAERAQVISTGQDVQLYSLSTRDADGKIQCFDVTMSLAIANNGKPANTAVVSSEACPKVKVGEFVPGTYQTADGGATCSLVASPFAGRTQIDFYCTYPSGYEYTFTWYTGPIKGSPIEAELKTAGLNTLPGNEEYAWGRVTRTDYGFGCQLRQPVRRSPGGRPPESIDLRRRHGAGLHLRIPEDQTLIVSRAIGVRE
jgi:hypothetical protein